MATDDFPLKKWKHPKTGKVRVYVNGEDVEDVKIWLEESMGGLAQICTNTDCQKPGAVAGWIREDAMREGKVVSDYVVEMALNDVGLKLPCMFADVLQQAE